MDNENAQKRAEIFSCEVCDYTCSKKSDLIRHFSTRKHSRITMDNETKMSKMYNCPCGKVYKHSSGLSKHKRNCTIYNRTNGNTTTGVLLRSSVSSNEPVYCSCYQVLPIHQGGAGPVLREASNWMLKRLELAVAVDSEGTWAVSASTLAAGADSAEVHATRKWSRGAGLPGSGIEA